MTFRRLREQCRAGDVASLLQALSSGAAIHGNLIRTAAAQHLGHLRAPDAVPALIRMLDDPDENARRAAVIALGSIGDASATPHLLESLNDPDRSVEAQSVRAHVISSL